MATPPPSQGFPVYPEPLVMQPKSGTHEFSFVVLHGRGSNAEKFGLELLRTSTIAHNSLQAAFPHARFIFPTASKRRARIYHRSIINQWFDNWSLDTPEEREELQIEGLRESSGYIHHLLRLEVAAVGAQNVVLWGLSQGCATTLVSTLLWTDEPLAAVVGMCGWLPLRKRMLEAVQPADEGDDLTIFDKDESDDETHSGHEAPANKLDKATTFLREELDLSPSDSRSKAATIPVFVGHGALDGKVPVELGRKAAAFCMEVGLDVTLRVYDDLDHWYSPEMLQDIVEFLGVRLKDH